MRTGFFYPGQVSLIRVSTLVIVTRQKKGVFVQPYLTDPEDVTSTDV